MNNIREENGKYMCLKHQKVISLIALDNRVLPENQMLCDTCMEENRQPLNQVLSLTQAKEMIKERLIKCIEGKEERINQQQELLKNLSQSLIELRQEIMKNVETLTRIIDKWGNWLNDLIKKNEIIDLIKGLELLQKDQKEFLKVLEESNKAYLLKVYQSFNKLYTVNGFKSCYQTLKELEINQIKQQNVSINYQLTFQTYQEEIQRAIAFNSTGSIMASGAKQDIKVWLIDKGKMNILTTLEGKGDCISCLKFSQINAWFLSGDWYGNIICWKQGSSLTEWTKNYPQKIHTSTIRCILFTKNEDKILTCSDDGAIINWNVRYEINQIDYLYTLENKHSNWVCELSLNESETALVSCSADQQLILWGKNGDTKWEYRSSLIMDKTLIRARFIRENQILVQQGGLGETYVIEVENFKLKQLIENKIKLNNENDEADYVLYPTIYIKSKGIIISKINRFLYIVKKSSKDRFQSETSPIDCETKDHYAASTQNGDVLVIFNDKTKQFRLYMLKYSK